MTEPKKSTSVLLDELLQWLDSKQSHLDNETRRQAVEAIVTAYHARRRRARLNRARGRDFLLLLGVGGGILTIATGIWQSFGGIFQ